MKNPAVVHFKCLDTFALEGVARTFGTGAAGVRLTHDGLEAHIRPSRRRRQSEAVQIDEWIAAELHDEKSQTRTPVVVGAAPVLEVAPIPLRVNLPRAPEARRSSMPSLVTIEAVGSSLRRPTTWAVVLLTLGISFGVVLARVASNAAVLDSATASPGPVSPVMRAMDNAASPPTTARAAPASLAAASLLAGPITLATTRIVGRHHHHHSTPIEEASAEIETTPSSPDVTETPAPPAAKGPAVGANAPPQPAESAHGDADDGDEVTAAAAAAERVHRELNDSL